MATSNTVDMLKTHQELVELLSCACPCMGSGCIWRGPLNQVIGHLSKEHPGVCYMEGREVVLLATEVEEPHSCDWFMIQRCHRTNFLVMLLKRIVDGRLKMLGAVQYIGHRSDAHKFIYTLEIKTATKAMTYTSATTSVMDSVSSVVLEHDCLDLEWQKLKIFETNGVVSVTSSIQKNRVVS